MKVLSLFDGISCGMVALERAGIPVERYVAYEIDENAIKVSKRNYPQIEHFGDVTKADFTQYKGFDLLIGGSPCQNMSTLGNRTGLQGEKSSLFFEFARALKEVSPKFFFLENNSNMPKADRQKITEILGVRPIEINSSIFVPQNRPRLYWIGKKTETGDYETINIELPQTTKTNLREVIADYCEKNRSCSVCFEKDSRNHVQVWVLTWNVQSLQFGRNNPCFALPYIPRKLTDKKF